MLLFIFELYQNNVIKNINYIITYNLNFYELLIVSINYPDFETLKNIKRYN